MRLWKRKHDDTSVDETMPAVDIEETINDDSDEGLTLPVPDDVTLPSDTDNAGDADGDADDNITTVNPFTGERVAAAYSDSRVDSDSSVGGVDSANSAPTASKEDAADDDDAADSDDDAAKTKHVATTGRNGDDGFDFLDDDEGDDDGSADELAMSPDERKAHEKKTKRRNIIIYIIIGIVILALLGAMGWALYANAHKETLKTQGSSVSNSLSSGNKSDTSTTSDSSTPTQKLMKAMDIPEFYQKAEDTLTDDEKTEANDYAMANADANAYAAFPMNSDYTDDITKAFNDDGTVNQKYSYLTADNVIPVIQDDIQRLINPVYGNWTSMQSYFADGEGIDINGKAVSQAWMNLADMFSKDVSLSTVDDAHKAMNLYADWNNDSYDGKYTYKTSSTPIVGSVTGQDCTYNIQGVTTDSIDCTVNVRYGTYLTTQKDPVYEDKTMVLHYKVNYDEQLNSDRRILLTGVEQN